MIDWNDLRIVLAVAEHRSLSKAAAALGVHQTTCGRRLDRLEAGLRAKLFLRSRRGLVPTAAAAQILGTVGNLASTLNQLEKQIGDDPARGTVRLAATENTSRQLIHFTLPKLRKRCPEVTLELMPANAVADLARGEADLAVRLVRPDDAELVKRRLGWVRYGLFASESYLAKRGAERPQLAGDTIVQPSRELASGPEATWLRGHAAAAQVTLASNNMVLMAQAGEQGLGLVVLPINFSLLHPRLRLLRLLPDIPLREAWLAIHRSVRDHPRVKVVADAVTETIRGLLR
jgi:DNA-binding transcriptional LysR family regulator